jgi:AcrR family transcriptional regulator
MRDEEDASLSKIAAACGVSKTTVLRFLDPGYRERQLQGGLKRSLEARQRRYKRLTERRRIRRETDPEYAARVKAQRRIHKLREYARQEAKETGKPVEEIFALWKLN